MSLSGVAKCEMLCQSRAFFVAFMAFLIGSCGSDRQPTSSHDAGSPADVAATPIVVTPIELDFGMVAKGSRHEQTVWLRNNTSQMLEIALTKSSCDCFHLKLETDVLEPGEKTQGLAVLDFSAEPQFTGRLGLDLQGFGKSPHSILFIVRGKVAVQSSAGESP
jgi:hypothetical protein